MFVEYEGDKILCKIRGEVKSKCPVTHETDYNKFVIEYIPRDKIIEVLALKTFLENFKDKEMLCEKLGNVLNEIVKELNPVYKKVVVLDDSFGFDIEVEVLC